MPLAELAVVGYFLAAAFVGLLPAEAGISHESIASALAFSPDDLVSGKLWLLPLSSLVVDGDTWPQLALLAEVAVLLVTTAGARTFWRAAIAGHVGSTLIAYAIVGVLALTHPTAVTDVVSDPDYGISCVWAGCLGALAAFHARRAARRTTAIAIFAVLSLPVVVLLTAGFVTPAGTLDLASVEHALAFGLGVAVVWRTDPARDGSGVRRAATSRLSRLTMRRPPAPSSRTRLAG